MTKVNRILTEEGWKVLPGEEDINKPGQSKNNESDANKTKVKKGGNKNARTNG